MSQQRSLSLLSIHVRRDGVRLKTPSTHFMYLAFTFFIAVKSNGVSQSRILSSPYITNGEIFVLNNVMAVSRDILVRSVMSKIHLIAVSQL